jgi:hypothetical protein
MRGKTIGTSLFTVFLVAALAMPASAATSRSNVYRFADGTQVSGAWSVVARSDADARMTLRTADLPAGHAVTVWWIIFNEPQNCTHPEGPLRCGPGDLPPFGGDDSAVTSIVYAAGHVVGGSGFATFSGRLATGDTQGALFGPGLVNPTTADIHLIVRDHGPAQDPSQQIHTFGACNPTCTDVQFSPHQQ